MAKQHIQELDLNELEDRIEFGLCGGGGDDDDGGSSGSGGDGGSTCEGVDGVLGGTTEHGACSNGSGPGGEG